MDFYHFVQVAHEWQDLLGAFVGAFLAIIFSAIGFLVARWVHHKDERKEALRQIEISNTYSLHTSYTMQSKLLFFVERAKKLVAEVKANTTPNEFIFNTINFPALGEIYLDSKSHSARVKSYYLHNKLLIMHAGTTDFNLILSQLKDDFANIQRMNEMLVGLMSNNPKPPIQRAAYAENLEAFALEVERIASEEIPKSMKIMVQIRVYNGKMRKTWGRGFISRLRYEGLRSSKRDLEMVDRIDTLIELEVEADHQKAQERAERFKVTHS